MTKSSKGIIALLVIILVAVLGIGGFVISNRNDKNVLTNQEALELGNSKYEEAIKCYWNIEGDTAIVNEDGYYQITNINNIKEVFTANAFSKFCTELGIVEKNGLYYNAYADRGSDISYLENELKVDNISENKITFTSIEKYCVNEEDYGLEAEQVQNITTEEYTFTIVKEDGNWKVDEFTLPN